MKKLESFELSYVRLKEELEDLQNLLDSTTTLKERDQVRPFFAERPNLCAALGYLANDIALPDLMSSEQRFFDDFIADVAVGDSESRTFNLIEFEDAYPYSIFKRLEPGKLLKHWSGRFEHGQSQLIDWAWRLSEEGSSKAVTRIFGTPDPAMHLILIIGRDSDLTQDDLVRLRWRTNALSLGAYKMSCFTFDGVLNAIRRRLVLADRAVAETA